MSQQRLYFEAPHSDEDSITFAVDDQDGRFSPNSGRFLAVSVAQEHAVDSYNSTFECVFHLSIERVAELRNWLAETFP